jgi:AraC family transcriptional regulator of adaptative response / DNA-3-methyladenine glycosylase II
VSGIAIGQDDPVLPLDEDQCYRAVTGRDRRFDGWFVMAVRSTGIYCRPSCPARTPGRDRVEFHPTAAAAQQRGFRACKRCRPDTTPGSPEWDLRADVVGRAMRLIADGVVDREGVGGLAARLGYSSRHVTRILREELGAGPLAIARAQRAQTARLLIETTDLPLGQVAFAAGFGSIRQFDDTVRAVYGDAPRRLRALASARRSGPTPGAPSPADTVTGTAATAVTVRLAVRPPFAADELVGFLAARAVDGLETVTEVDGAPALRRSLRLPAGHGTVEVRLDGQAPAVLARFRLEDWSDLAPAVGRVRRWLGLDADPVAVDAALGEDPVLAPLVAATPGLRAAGSVDPLETALRAVVGQQVSVAGARTVVGRIVAMVGEPLRIEDPVLAHVGPTAEQLATLDPARLPMPRRRAATIVELGQRVASGALRLDPGEDRDEVTRRLLEVPGIGPWTADYVRMRGLGDPDVWLPTDLGVVRGAQRLGIGDDLTARAAAWRPWRTTALHHLWSVT